MKLDQSMLEGYLTEMQNHLFGGISIDEIIEQVGYNHRARRFIAIYLLKNKDTFHHYYSNRTEMGIEYILDIAISSLFYERSIKPIKQELINLLEINENIFYRKVEGYPLKEFDKDLNSLLVYWRKRSGGLMEMLPKLDVE